MPASSRIPSAQDGLKALLEARAGLLALVQKKAVTVGWPRGSPQAEHVWVSGDVRDWRQTWELTGGSNAPREETFTLVVSARVLKTADNYAAARDRVLSLVAEIEAAVRSDVTLGGAVFHAELAGGDIEEGVPDESQREVLADVRVACTAFLV